MAVIALVERDRSASTARKWSLIIGDTLARISAGANENSGEDMGVVLRNADAIRTATGADVLWVHHCGKDQARGMRGWSGMRAAIDTEIEMTATGDRAARRRDHETARPSRQRRPHRVPLEAVTLGVNRWGTPRSSCVVFSADAPPKQAKNKRLTSEIAGAITEFLTQRGCGCKKGELVKQFKDREARKRPRLPRDQEDDRRRPAHRSRGHRRVARQAGGRRAMTTRRRCLHLSPDARRLCVSCCLPLPCLFGDTATVSPLSPHPIRGRQGDSPGRQHNATAVLLALFTAADVPDSGRFGVSGC